jgi:phosphoribosylamine---glycine ligase
MNILLLGSGGREHALAWKMAQSKLTKKLYIAPGNGGTEEVGENISLNISNFEATKRFLISKKISLVVVGPEQPLVDGFADNLANDLELNHINVIGPKKLGATLEGSKDFSKQFMFRNGVPTAAYQSFTKYTLNEGLAFLESLKAPYVLKADGLAAGKGVLILDDLAEAKQELTSMFDGKFGDASNTVVIEEFLDGIELSVFVVTDGKDYVILPEAKDYKRIGEGDKGLNTGGMGAVSPVPFAKGEFLQKVEEKVIKPTINGLAKDRIEYKGFIFFGLIKVNNEPFVIEYNVRMGDPETEVVIPRIQSDLVALFDACGKGALNNYKLEVMDETALTIVAVSGGYPGNYEKGKLISGIKDAQAGIYFHAGTKSQGDDLVTWGGRVIASTGFGNTLVKAKNNALTMVNSLRFQGKYYRKDIGSDLEGLI